ncbi:ATP synthase subunit b 3 [Azospirillaceae bacterium]
MLKDPTFWVAIAFVLFVVFMYKRVSTGLTGFLDQRSARIRSDIEEARRLRDEAQKLFAEAKKREEEAETEAANIVAHAREDAERMHVRAAERIQEMIQQREAQAVNRIALVEASAVAEIRNMTVDIAIAACQKLLIEHRAVDGADPMVDAVIAELPRHLN